jgi:hypothetical protein
MAIKKQINQTKSDPAGPQPVKIFDVAKPGILTPAGATTRPVIVSNRAVMQDPMMVARPQGDIAGKDVSSEPQNVSAKMIIKPLSEPPEGTPHDTDADGVLEPGEIAADLPVSQQVSRSPEVELMPQPAVPRPSNTPAETVAATTDTSSRNDDEPAEVDVDKDVARMEAEAKAQDELDTLVEQKKYFLPINAVSLRRSRHVAIFGIILIILLAIAWLDIALDAGFVTIPGLHALTHLFHN